MVGAACTFMAVALTVNGGGIPERPVPTLPPPPRPIVAPSPAVLPLVEPADALTGPPPPYMDPRTHAWTQHRIPPPNHLSACGGCPEGAWCLGDRRQRNCWDRMWECYRRIRYRKIGIPTGPGKHDMPTLPAEAGDAPHPE